MNFEEDLEVVADLKLRAASQFDRTRTFGAGVYDWSPPEIVEQWTCRGCGVPVPVTQEATDACSTFDRELARRSEPALDRRRIAFCADCRNGGVKISADRNRKQVGALNDLIRQLKAEPAPNEAYTAELLRKCALLHHPDVDGLKQAIEIRRASKSSKRERKAGL